MKKMLSALLPALVVSIAAADDACFLWPPPSDVVVVKDRAYMPVTWHVERDRKGEITWNEPAYLGVFDLAANREIGRMQLSGHPQAAALCGKFLVCSTGGELLSLELSNPDEPKIAGRVEVGKHVLERVERVRAVGDLLFCAAGRKGLLVYRLGADGAFSLAGSFRGEGWGACRSVAVEGARAAVADSLGLVLLNYERTGETVRIEQRGRIVLPFMSQSVAMEGDIAVVGGGAFELQVVDISDPERPELVGRHKRITNYYGVAFFDLVLRKGLVHIPMGEYAYVAVDVADPKNPRMATEFRALWDFGQPGDKRFARNRYYRGIHVDHEAGRVYLASERNLEVVDVSDPKRPKTAAWINPADAVMSRK